MVRVTDEHIQERSDMILAAATRTFARKGVAVATMQDVAAEAGLSVGAIYRYYSGKEHLAQAVFDRIRDRNRSLFAKVAERSDSPEDLLRNAGRVIAARSQQDPSGEEIILVAEAILANARRSDRPVAGERQLRDAYTLLTERFFRQAQEEGVLDPDINSEGLALLFVSLVVGLHVLSLESRDPLELAPVAGVVNEMLLRFAP